MLLFIISAFYVPAVIDLKRYRPNAWIADPALSLRLDVFYLGRIRLRLSARYLPIGFVDLTIFSSSS